MSTTIRPKISEKNKYWVSKHRYYELKHFCLQYPDWKKAYAAVGELFILSPSFDEKLSNSTPGDPTSKRALVLAYYAALIKMVDDSAKEADKYLAPYILKGVTEERSYEYLNTKLGMPCCKDTYYDRYRKFFWILSKSRN